MRMSHERGHGKPSGDRDHERGKLPHPALRPGVACSSLLVHVGSAQDSLRQLRAPRTPRAGYAPSSHCRASCGPPTSTRTMGAWTMPPRSAGRGTFSTMNRPRAAVGRQHAGAIPLTTFLTVFNGSYGEKRVPSDARHDARGSTAGVVAQRDATTFRHGRAPALDKPPRRAGSARGQTVTSPPWDSSVA